MIVQEAKRDGMSWVLYVLMFVGILLILSSVFPQQRYRPSEAETQAYIQRNGLPGPNGEAPGTPRKRP